MDLEFRDNDDETRFEVLSDGERVGFVEYRLAPDRIALLHTETDPEMRGHGVASRLIRHALDEARTRGLDVLPYCPFVRGFIEEHDEYLDLVPDEVRSRFGLPEA